MDNLGGLRIVAAGRFTTGDPPTDVVTRGVKQVGYVAPGLWEAFLEYPATSVDSVMFLTVGGQAIAFGAIDQDVPGHIWLQAVDRDGSAINPGLVVNFTVLQMNQGS